MSVDRKEVDLIIQAQLKNGKTLDSVSKSIREIESALDDQADAAKRGEGSIDSLKATLAALKQTQDDLKKQADLIGQFDKLGKSIGATEERVARSAKAFEDYRAKLDKAGESTERQQAKLVKLGEAADRNASTLARQKADYQALSETLRQSGVDVANLSAAEDKVRQSALTLGVAMRNAQDEIAGYAETVRLAATRNKALADTAAFDRQVEEAAKLNKASQYVRFWEDALRDADAAQEQLKINDALRKAADEAVAAARGYKTLGTVAQQLGASSGGLREVIQGILDPSKQARQTLAGVEDQVLNVGKAVASIKGPLTDYKTQVKQLADIQKAIGQQASLIDSFQRQTAAVRSARQAYSDARAQVLSLAEQVRNAGTRNNELEASLRRAQGTLESTRSTLIQEIEAARGLQTQLKQSGIATNDLAGAQSKLTNAAQSTVSTLRTLETAHAKFGEAAKKPVEAFDLFNNSGRTTLSLAQRIRGEILAMAAAYVGLYGAIGGANKVLEAFNTKQGIQNQLALTVGNDQKRIADEYKYIQQQAERIGLSFEQAAKGYAKFSASAKLAGRDSQEIRFIFETFSEVGRVANLSADDMEGVFKALEQVMSKGTIQAEELRGQLGDRLFGAFQVAAKALKDQFPNLDQAMKNGQVSADQLVKIAEKYKEIVGPQLGAATANLSANQNRLNTALFEFKTLVAESGFADQYARLVETLTTFFKSNDGERFARDLSKAFGTVVDGLTWIVQNLELVKAALAIAFSLYGTKLVLGLGNNIKDLAGKLKLASDAFGTMSTASRIVLKSFALINAAVIGWEIGTYLREKFDGVRFLADKFVIMLVSAWTRMKYYTEIAWKELPNIILDALSATGNVATKGLRSILEIFSKAARALGKTELADSIDGALKALTLRTDRMGSSSAKLLAQMEADLKKIKDIGDEMEAETVRAAAGKPRAGSTSATASPGTAGSTGTTTDEKALAKRIKLKQEIEAALQDIENKIRKADEESLDAHIKAIEDSYQRLINKIGQLGGQEAVALSGRLSALKKQLIEQETKDFNERLAKEASAIQKTIDTAEGEAGRKNNNLQARLDAVVEQYRETYARIAALRETYLKNSLDVTAVDKQKADLDAAVRAKQDLETRKFYEDEINAILDERKAKLDLIAVQEKTGLITASKARDDAQRVIAETQPRLDAVAAKALEYVNNMIAAAQAIGQNTQGLETLKAKIIEAAASSKELSNEYLYFTRAGEAAQSAFGGFLDKVTSGKVTFKQALLEMLADFTKALAKMAQEALAKDVMGNIFNKENFDQMKVLFGKLTTEFAKMLGIQVAEQQAASTAISTTKGTEAATAVSANAATAASGAAASQAAIPVVGPFLAAAAFAAIMALVLGAMTLVRKHHSGGVVGSGGSVARAHPGLFAGAPRYHGGGIAGLAPDEYPAILKKNEEVLTQGDPRNVLNGGLAGGGGSNSPMNVKIVNAFDAAGVVSEGLATPEGEKAIMNFVRTNRTSLKAIIG